MKRCVLCKSTATIYCESDRASLCWTCDAKVHSANFLVARHSRSLLCQICHSQTLWSSSGEKLCPSTTAICGTCHVKGVSGEDVITEGVVGGNADAANGDEIDNQVVAWLPPPVSSSSSEEVSLKRKHHEDEIDSSSANVNHYNYKPSPTVGNRKKLCERNIKSERTLDLDLNLPAIE